MSEPIKILLAEDQEEHARLLKAVLTRAQYQVHHVKNGVDAYEKIKSGEHFDLLLTDILMPGMTGFELLLRLKQENLTLPTIVLTAKQSDEDVLRGLNAGALDYITKPFSPSVIIAKVKITLQKLRAA